MDDFTYGNSPAAVALSKIITETNPKLSWKVGKIWEDFSTGIKRIAACNITVSLKEQLIDMWHDNNKIRIKNSSLPDKVKSYLMNVSYAKYSDTKKTFVHRRQ